jgi:hypothetical protein
MTADQAKQALQFLARVDLKGAEAPLFMDVCAALDRYSKGSAPATPDAVTPGV